MAELRHQMESAVAGRYRVERELGRGGMATVFLAEDLKHHRPVAIKVLLPELAAALGSGRFLREIESAARLTHPHILPLHDSGEAEGLLYYVMPYVEGESLRQRLEREKQLPLGDALRIAREVADALDYAHRHGVVHRDIKPENILLEERHAVVADFGIARAIVAAGGEKLTTSGVVLGTPAYMSPEQAVGSRQLDGRSDLYSLACVLYEMLAGEPPFTGPTGESLAHQHLNVAPRPVRALRTAVPESVDRALAKALAKPAADRFGTAAEFAAALEPGIAAPDRTGEAAQRERPGARRETHRARWLVIAGAAILVAVGAFLVARDPDVLSRWPGGSRTTPPAKKDWILVAEFEGPPDDPSLARAARELVSAALDQSSVVAAVPRDQIQVALQQAGKPDTLRLTPELAREIAYRSTVRAVLEGEVARLGDRYAVTLRVTDVEENKQLVTLTDVARSEDGLIPLLTRMGARVGERLGVNPGMIRTTRAGEGTIATSSFEAYRRESEGLRAYYEGDFAGALALWREALAIDREFGGAWASLGFAYRALGKPDSALLALEEASRHPRSLTPAYRLLNEGRVVWWRGDARSATETFDRVTRLYPRSVEAAFAFNYEQSILMSQGRFQEAHEADVHFAETEAVARSPLGRSTTVGVLIPLGRLAEARSEALGLQGTFRQQAELNLALAGGDWGRADSLARTYERASNTGVPVLVQAASARAQVAAVHGEVSVAEAHLRRAETLQHERGNPALATRTPRARVLLALVSGRPVPRPEPWLGRDTTTSALITRAYMAAASGETTLARHLLARLRARTTTRLGAHGSTPEFIEAWIAARAGHWNDAVALIAEPAREGSDRGSGGSDPSSERAGSATERWLVAQAYERLGQPDSAAAFYLRMLGPEMPTIGLTGLVYSFAHQRLVLLYARMGGLEEAERHLAILERDFTRPDPDVRHLLDEARAAVSSARPGAPGGKALVSFAAFGPALLFATSPRRPAAGAPCGSNPRAGYSSPGDRNRSTQR